MKTKITLLAAIATLFVSAAAYANSTDVTATLEYYTPITIQELSAASFGAERKPGSDPAAINVSNRAFNSAAWNDNFNSTINQTPGCVKVLSDPNSNVRVSITPPATLTDGGKTLTFDSAAVIGGATCGDASGYSATYVDGSTDIAANASGELTFGWQFDPATSVSLADITTATYTGAATVTVNYP